jgi:hypothetical protein
MPPVKVVERIAFKPLVNRFGQKITFNENTGRYSLHQRQEFGGGLLVSSTRLSDMFYTTGGTKRIGQFLPEEEMALVIAKEAETLEKQYADEKFDKAMESSVN